MKLFFQSQPSPSSKAAPISGSMDLITKFDLTKQYKKYCSQSSSLKLAPTFKAYLQDIPGTIDTNADSSLKDSIFGPQPPEMDKNLLNLDDLKLEFTLDDAPVDANLFDIEPVEDDEFEKCLQSNKNTIKTPKFIIRLPSFGAKPAAPKAPSSEPIKDHDQKQVQSIAEVPLQGEGTSKKSSSSRSAIDTKKRKSDQDIKAKGKKQK